MPGTVGAGVRGNVGAFGGEIKDRLVAAEVLQFDDKNVDVLEMKNEDFNFSYRPNTGAAGSLPRISGQNAPGMRQHIFSPTLNLFPSND